jgi:TIR domain
MSKPIVFVSYSHHDRKEMVSVVQHLSVLSDKFKAEGWQDTQIQAGMNWEKEIYDAIDSATVAILLITVNFLNSEFIKNKELPRLLERKRRGEIRIIPLIMKHCAWDQVEWLQALEVRPKGGAPVWGSGNTVDLTLTDFAKEVGQIIQPLGPAATPGRLRARPARRLHKQVWYCLAIFMLFFVGWAYLRNLTLKQLSKDWQVGPTSGTLSFPMYVSPGEQEVFQLNGYNSLDKDIPIAFQLINNGSFKLDVGQGNDYFCNGWAQKNNSFKHQLTVYCPLQDTVGQSLFDQPAGLSLWGHAGNVTHQKLADFAMLIAPVPYIRIVIVVLWVVWAGLLVLIATAMWKQMKS